MSRYIDFYLIGELVDSHGNVHYEDLKYLLTADVVEVKHGEWIKFDEGDCYCSNCEIALEDWVQGIFYKFCPNCGADMRGKEDERNI